MENYTSMTDANFNSNATAVEDKDHDNVVNMETEMKSSFSEDKEITKEYKKKALEYCKLGQKHKLKFTSVQSKFRRLKSNRQLYR